MEQMEHLSSDPKTPLFRVQGLQTREQYVSAVTCQQLIRPLNGLYSFLAGVCPAPRKDIQYWPEIRSF